MRQEVVLGRSLFVLVVASLAGCGVQDASIGPGGERATIEGDLTAPFLSYPLGSFGTGITCDHDCYANHRALDLNAYFVPVYAAAEGTVIVHPYDANCGNFISIQHPNGFLTKYCHLSEFWVTHGQQVTRGQGIAKSGNSGNVDARLHFVVCRGGECGRSFGTAVSAGCPPGAGRACDDAPSAGSLWLTRNGVTLRGSEQLCQDGCVAGAKQCAMNTAQSCRDTNGDGCVEWADDQTCGSGSGYCSGSNLCLVTAGCAAGACFATTQCRGATCTGWTDLGCGQNGCGALQMSQRRACEGHCSQETSCQTTSRCAPPRRSPCLSGGFGDVDGDGWVEHADAELVLRGDLQLVTLTTAQRARADVNRDGVVNVADTQRISSYLIKPGTFAACPKGFLGDVDCDGDRDSADSLKVQRVVAGLDQAVASCPTATGTIKGPAGDMDRNGALTAVDANLILQCAAGLPSCLTR